MRSRIQIILLESQDSRQQYLTKLFIYKGKVDVLDSIFWNKAASTK